VGPKVLIVEDDVRIQQVLCVFLEYSGFEVCGVRDGEEAISVIPEFCPELIVLDLMMQPVSGWEVLHWLRASGQSALQAIPVLILTALTPLAKQVQGFEAGAVEYMTKPMQPSVMVERICTILSLSVEQRLQLQQRRMDEQRMRLEHVHESQAHGFSY